VLHRPGKVHGNADALSRLADLVRGTLNHREFVCEVPASLPVAALEAASTWPAELEGPAECRRVAALITDGRSVLMARLSDGSYTFGSVPHSQVRRPFVEVCAEAVSRYLCEVSTANAALMLGRSRQILAAPRHRFLVVPRTGGTLDGRVLRPGVMWVDTLDAGSVDAIRCALPDEAWALRALQHCATNWARGEFTPKYPAISRAFLELGLLAARAPSEHTERSTALVSVLAPAGSLEPGPATSTVDGRAVPTALLSDPGDVADALCRLHDWLARARALEPEGGMIVLALDMEFSLRPMGAPQSCDILQVACGPLIFVFDVLRNRRILSESDFTRDVPSLRGLFEAPDIIKVVHHGSNDGLVLRAYGIKVGPVFDTAVADALLTKGDVSARNLGEVHDAWLLEGFRRSYPERTEILREGLLPFKHSFAFEWGLFRKRPLEPMLLQYCWQDVAYMPALYATLRANLLALSPPSGGAKIKKNLLFP